MESVDARNLQTLIGTVDLSQCPRLIEALFGGTNTTAVIISAGSKIERLELPDSITSIDLRDTKFLEDLNIGTLANVRFLRLENVPTINAFGVLKEAYNTEGQQLKDIRLVGFTYAGDATDLDMIANLATDKDKDGNEHYYNGIDSNGVPDANSNPVLEGNLNIDGYVYEETANIVRQYYPTIEFTPKGYYVRFQDPEVLQVLLANGVGDGVGITTAQAAAVTSIGTWFSNNTAIERFDELGKFTNVTNLLKSAFANCTSLASVDISNIETFGVSSFAGCLNLVFDILVLPKAQTFGQYALDKVKVRRLELPNLSSYTEGNVYNSTWGDRDYIEEILLSDAILAIKTRSFYQHTALRYVGLNWSGITSIGERAFYNCTSLEFEDLSLPNLTKLGQDAFYGVKIKKISNLGKLTALPSATTSTQNFGDKSVLEEVVLPNTLTSIPAYSFYNYTNMIIKDLNMQALTSIGNSAFRNTKIENVSNLGSIATLGNGGSAGDGVFQDCTSLTRVVLPEGLTTIGGFAFSGCTSLSECNIPSTVTSIGINAFAGTALKRIIVPEGVTKINRYLCANCPQLELLDIPSTITNLEWHILRDSSETTLICRNPSPPSADGEALRYSNLTYIYVPDASVEAYKTASVWSSYASRIKPLSEYTE